MVSVDKDEILEVIRVYEESGEVTELASISDIRKETKKNGEKPSRGQISGKTDELRSEGKVKIEVGDSKGRKKRFATPNFDPIGLSLKREIQNSRQRLKSRILREPTIEEVAEELGQEPSEQFRSLFRQSVSDEWREPSPEQVEKAKDEVQKRVEEATELFLWEEEREAIEENVADQSISYFERNSELFSEFDYDSDLEGMFNKPMVIRVKVSPKIGKFMKEDSFILEFPYYLEEKRGDEKVGEFTERITEKARNLVNS
jgi:hypothetical protein